MNSKIGILLVNLGSPSAPTAKATRKYLSQFLKDRRVIELTPLLWWPILHGVILRTRPAKSARAYATIWKKDKNGKFLDFSTLVETTIIQAQALEDSLGGAIPVRAAMRYGQPSLETEIQYLHNQGCNQIQILPLYPQYAGATTGSVNDIVARLQNKIGSQTQLKCAHEYFDHPLYISALVKSLKKYLHIQDWQADKILVSFHGLPKSSIEKGDPYEIQCEATFAKMKQALPNIQDKMVLTYQSRFGPKQWLTPYTSDVLKDCAEKGEKNIIIITPGFAADCLETLEELAIREKEDFLGFGGEKLQIVPCLNANSDHIKLLEALVKTNIF